MRQSKIELYIHAVWATKRRAPFLLPAIEVVVHDKLRMILRERQCVSLAVNGMEDHVHIVARIPSTISVAALLKHLKGESSNLIRETFEMDDLFTWQEGYAAFSVSRSHVARVVAYVENQKRHHATGRLWSEWERTVEETSITDENGQPDNRP